VKATNSALRVAVVIPSRYGASRLPGKPLAEIDGRPMIWHVWDKAARAKIPARVVVATDDERIASAVRGFGGIAVMTSPDCPSGTDRVAEAVPETLPEQQMRPAGGCALERRHPQIGGLLRRQGVGPRIGAWTFAGLVQRVDVQHQQAGGGQADVEAGIRRPPAANPIRVRGRGVTASGQGGMFCVWDTGENAIPQPGEFQRRVAEGHIRCGLRREA